MKRGIDCGVAEKGISKPKVPNKSRDEPTQSQVIAADMASNNSEIAEISKARDRSLVPRRRIRRSNRQDSYRPSVGGLSPVPPDPAPRLRKTDPGTAQDADTDSNPYSAPNTRGHRAPHSHDLGPESPPHFQIDYATLSYAHDANSLDELAAHMIVHCQRLLRPSPRTSGTARNPRRASACRQATEVTSPLDPGQSSNGCVPGARWAAPALPGGRSRFASACRTLHRPGEAPWVVQRIPQSTSHSLFPEQAPDVEESHRSMTIDTALFRSRAGESPTDGTVRNSDLYQGVMVRS